MELKRYEDPREFQDAAWPFLLRNEAVNNIMLGMVPQLVPGGGDFLCTFHDGQAIVGAAMMMTGGRPLDISETPDEAVELLAATLADAGTVVPSVLSTPRCADLFVEYWTNRTSAQAHRYTFLAVHQLDRVIAPPAAPGSLRQVRAQDAAVASAWITAFCSEIGEPCADGDARAQRVIEQQRLFFWEAEGEPVSCAAWTRPMPNGIAIGLVYTPPQQRGRGYASNCVAGLSQRMLDSGKRFCALFTDLANPTSNKIYRQIGYQQIGKSKHVFFQTAAGGI